MQKFCMCLTSLHNVPCGLYTWIRWEIVYVIEKASFRIFRPQTQTQDWYKNIKCYIFCNLSFRNHSLLGGRLSSVLLFHRGENSGDFLWSDIDGAAKAATPTWKLSAGSDILESDHWMTNCWEVGAVMTVLICRADPSHKLWEERRFYLHWQLDICSIIFSISTLSKLEQDYESADTLVAVWRWTEAQWRFELNANSSLAQKDYTGK